MKYRFACLLACLALPCAAQVAAPPPPVIVAPAATLPKAPAGVSQAAPARAADIAPAAAARANGSIGPAPLAVATATGAAARANGPIAAGEPEVRHTVIEGEATRIDELTVRGVPQRIVVTSKGRGGSYEIITGDGSRDLSDGANTSRGAAGKRVWRVLDF